MKQSDLLHIQPAMVYMHMARAVIDDYGIEGQFAIRKALAKYGTDRGLYLRKRHRELGMKTNLANFFYYNANPYQQVSFGEQMDHVTPQEDVRTMTSCPTMDLLVKEGERELAVMYCEEVHPTIWQAYAPTAMVNLGETLAQQGGKCCDFHVFLRPGRMTEQQRKDCFEEFDADFKGDNRDKFIFPTTKQAANMKLVMMIHAIYQCSVEHLGKDVVPSLRRGVKAFAEDVAEKAAQIAAENAVQLDEAFWDNICAFSKRIEEDSSWEEFSNQTVKELADDSLYRQFQRAI